MKNAVVTGGGRGLGRCIAVRLAADGYAVTVIDTDAAGAARSANEAGGTAVTLDVSDEAAVRGCAEAFDHVDVLVNNAGVWRHVPLAEVTMGEARRVFDVNVLGAFMMSQHLAPKLTTGGAIVNVSSTTALMPPSGVGLYPASKGAVISLTKALAVELGSRGIRVNAVAPGMIHTEGSAERYLDGTRRRQGSRLPLGRHGTPEDVAGVVSFLASDDARYITGQTIVVDGGLVLRGLGA